MISVLIELTTSAIRRLVEKSIDYGSNNLSKRRQILYRLIKFYDTVSTLEESSLRLLKDIKEISQGESVASIVISRKMIEKLKKNFIDFLDQEKDLSRILDIYDNELRGLISDGGHFKLAIWGQIDVRDEILPRVEPDTEGKATFLISFPTARPSQNELSRTDQSITRDNLKERIDRYKVDLQKSFRRVTINLRDRDALSKLAVEVETSAGMLSNTKSRLASLIRENFPLNSLLQ